MSARRAARLGAGLLLVAVGALVAPAAKAATSPAPRQWAPASLPDLVARRTAGGAVDVDRPKLNRTDLLGALDRNARARSALDLSRAVLEARTGTRLPDLHPASQLNFGADADAGPDAADAADAADAEPADHEEEETVEPSGTLLYPSPVGDIDGDGRADSAVFELDITAETLTLTLVDADGDLQWRGPAVDAFDAMLLPAGDTTGDGIVDLTYLSIGYDAIAARFDDCSNGLGHECYHLHFSDSFHWTYGVVSGADGTAVWSESTPGSMTWDFRYDNSGLGPAIRTETEVDTITGDNFYVDLSPSGDHDGDGRTDTVFNIVDAESTFTGRWEHTALALTEYETKTTIKATTHAAVRDGVTGSELLSRRATDAPTLGLLQPAGQVVGDATPDLLWDAYEYTPSRGCGTQVVGITVSRRCDKTPPPPVHQLSIVNGATLTEAWSSRSPVDWLSYGVVVPDITGDGTSDVARISWGEQDAIAFLDGPTGQHLWAATGYPLHIGEDLGGTGRPDVLMAAYEFDGDGLVMTYDRRHGATGALLGTTTRAVDPQVEDADDGWYALYAIDDAGGTASPDTVLWASLARGRGFDGADRPEQGFHMIVEDGRGAVVSEVRDDSMRTVDPVADIDGDGLVDALDGRAVVDNRMGWVVDWQTTAMVSLDDDAPLWGVDADFVLAAGDQDGAPGSEVLTVEIIEGDNRDFHSLIESRGGQTGAVRWSLQT